jgi:hypothetical protein
MSQCFFQEIPSVSLNKKHTGFALFLGVFDRQQLLDPAFVDPLRAIGRRLGVEKVCCLSIFPDWPELGSQKQRTMCDTAILALAKNAQAVLCGWGPAGNTLGRGGYVAYLLKKENINIFCFGLGRDAEPRSPAYMQGDQLFISSWLYNNKLQEDPMKQKFWFYATTQMMNEVFSTRLHAETEKGALQAFLLGRPASWIEEGRSAIEDDLCLDIFSAPDFIFDKIMADLGFVWSRDVESLLQDNGMGHITKPEWICWKIWKCRIETCEKCGEDTPIGNIYWHEDQPYCGKCSPLFAPRTLPAELRVQVA